MTSFAPGPTLPHDQPPWPLTWEQTVDESCPHVWERCVLLRGPARARADVVVRCRVCHVPRCGHSFDPDPCMERRHHYGVHIYVSGRFEPVGGYLREESR